MEFGVKLLDKTVVYKTDVDPTGIVSSLRILKTNFFIFSG
jgi:hypothetical protein